MISHKAAAGKTVSAHPCINCSDRMLFRLETTFALTIFCVEYLLGGLKINYGNNISEIQIDIPDHPGKQGVGPLKNQPQITAEPID